MQHPLPCEDFGNDSTGVPENIAEQGSGEGSTGYYQYLLYRHMLIIKDGQIMSGDACAWDC